MSYIYEFPKVADLTASFALFAFRKPPNPYDVEDAELFILLGKRKSTAKAFPGAWCIPGGFLNVGETFKECAIRELMEETGIDASSLDLYIPGIMPVDIFDDPDRDNRGRVVDYPYTASFCCEELPEPNLNHKECDLEEVRWIRTTELPDMNLAFDHNKIATQAYLKVLHG